MASGGYKTVPIGQRIESEIIYYLNNFGQLDINSPPVLLLPSIFNSITIKYIKYLAALYDLACMYLIDGTSKFVAVCRKSQLKQFYQDHYEEIFSYKYQDVEQVIPSHLSYCLSKTRSNLTRRTIRRQLGLPLSAKANLSCTQRQMDVNLQWKYEECKTKERLGYISTENRFLIPVSNPLSTNSAILIQPVPTCMPEPEKYPHIDLASYSNQSDSTSHIEYILNDGMENENFGTLYEREYGTYMYDRLSDLRSPFQSTSS